MGVVWKWAPPPGPPEGGPGTPQGRAGARVPPRFAQVLGRVALTLGLIRVRPRCDDDRVGPHARDGRAPDAGPTGYYLGRRLYFLRWWVPDLVTRIWNRRREGGPGRTLAPEPIRYS